MTAPLSPVNIANTPIQSPIGASGLSEKQLHLDTNRRIVANPPPSVYRYSVYDDLSLEKDRFKEILGSLKKEPPSIRKTKAKRFVKNLITLAVVTGGAIFAFRHRAGIKNVVVNSYNKIKNWFKG